VVCDSPARPYVALICRTRGIYTTASISTRRWEVLDAYSESPYDSRQVPPMGGLTIQHPWIAAPIKHRPPDIEVYTYDRKSVSHTMVDFSNVWLHCYGR
jgi:hypothetical protein